MQVGAPELAARLRGDRVLACVCVTQPANPATTMALAAAGVDAVYVDLEHTPLSLETASAACVGALQAGLLPLVRVPTRDASTIGRALDGGALGVIVPDVRSVEDVHGIVRAARLPPVGDRHPYLATAVLGYRAMPQAEALATLESSTVVAPMVESATGVKLAREMAAVEGVDMLLVGAFDLARDLGCGADAPELLDAIRAVGDACVAEGAVLGVLGLRTPEVLAELVPHGLGFAGIGTDLGLLQEGAAARATAAHDLRPRADRS